MQEEPTVVRTAQQLRALAHPLRVELMRQLIRGPARVGDLAQAVGEPSNSVSFHIRQLAKYGFVVRAEPPEEADRRESWWKLASVSGYSVDASSLLQNMGEARDAIASTVVAMVQRRLSRAQETLNNVDLSDPDPVGTGMMSETVVMLTKEQAHELRTILEELMRNWSEREPSEDARPFTLAVDFFPDPAPRHPTSD